VDGAFRIAFASPVKRLCRLAFCHLSTTCNFFTDHPVAMDVKVLKIQKDPKQPAMGLRQRKNGIV
jgi:hypothetical protein